MNRIDVLKQFEDNIIKWYDFGDKKKIFLDLENNKIIEGTKYDVIIITTIPKEYKIQDIVNKYEKYLNKNGKFLFAVDNKFGLRFFAGNPENIFNRKFESLLGYNNEKDKIETFTKRSLEKKLNELGYNTRFYYPLPDHRCPNVIFSDEQLPEYNSIDKYNPYYTEKSEILFNEIDVFREILKNDKEVFDFFANSFFVEASKGELNTKFKYISFNNLRKKEYRLITRISDDYVDKQMVDENSKEHYENIKENIRYLKANGFKTVDYIENNIIKSKYIEQRKLLNNILTELLEIGDKDKFYDIVDNFIRTISINKYKEINYENTIFYKYNIEIENKKIIEEMNFLPKGLWDMTFKNCFYIDEEFYFFDQEWIEDNIPVEFIIYRSILYTNSLRRFLKIEDLYEKYGLTKFLPLFKLLDDKLQIKIRDEKVWAYLSENHIFNIDDTKQEIINIKLRNDAIEGKKNNLKKEVEDLKKQNNILNKELEKTLMHKVKKIFKH